MTTDRQHTLRLRNAPAGFALLAILVPYAASVPCARAANGPPPMASPAAAQAIASWSGDQSYPRAAWHSLGPTHLVVFEDHYDDDGGYNIVGQRLDDWGTPYPGLVIVADDARHRTQPALAAGTMSAGLGFLVVHELHYSATDQDVLGRFVRTNGAMPDAEFAIDASSYWEYDPDVAWGGSPAGAYLVVWSKSSYPLEFQSDLWCALVKYDGTVTAPVQLTSVSGREDQATAAYDANTGGWLVAWCENQDIRGRRIGPDGNPLGPVFDLIVGGDVQKNPRLRAHSNLPQIGLVYQDDLGSSTGPFWIRAAIVSAAGVTCGPPLASQGTRDVPGPDLVYSTADEAWITIWEQYYSTTDHDIYALMFGSDLTAHESPRVVSWGTAMEEHPGLSVGVNLKVLAVWEDERNVPSGLGADIYGEVLPLGRLSGHVYRGHVGSTNLPLPGVTVRLIGSTSPLSLDNPLGQTTTMNDGSFALGYLNPPAYLHLVENMPPGNWADGATSLDGTVVSGNWIRYDVPVSIQEHPWNSFWLMNPLVSAPELVAALRLYPNQPNPFNPRTTIRFDLPAAGNVRLAVYDVAGRLIRVLLEGERPAGSYEAVWDGRDSTGRSAPSGSYLARLVAGGKVEGVRLSLVR